MASKLTERDKNILDANNFEVVGNKPYEDGKWGTQGPKTLYIYRYLMLIII